LVALALAAGFRWLDRRRAEQAAHPRVEGSLPIVGLGAPVGVVRDRNGVPHVRGQTESDAWLALGFVHAQDRLAQMLELRRAAQGRSAEVVGRSALPADRWARTLGLARLAASDLERAPRDVRQVLDAYARGVNARIARVRSGLAGPPLALSEDPETLEDWVPADSLALLKLQAWVLGNSVEASLVLETLIQKFGGLGARPFFPDGVGFRAVPPEPERTLASRRSGLDGGLPLRAQLGFAGRSIGSTAFAVSGALAARGGILLGADQHLEARAPAHLYEAHLRGGELDVAGATLPGIPVFWTGFTPDVVWASTHYPALVSDLFLESLKDEAPRRHWDRGGWRLLEVREDPRGGAHPARPSGSPPARRRASALDPLDGSLGHRWPRWLAGAVSSARRG
jgi:penicillin amidase